MATTAAVAAEAVKIRDPGFARRLNQAAQSSPHCPGPNGRLSWIAAQLNARSDRWEGSKVKTGNPKKISAQTVSRWFSGETKPRKDKNDILAEVLGVDAVWLYLGTTANSSAKERAARNALAAGAVNIVAGLIQMDGGIVAFPDDNDVHASKDSIHLDAIIKGRKYSFHVIAAEDLGDSFQFVIPHSGEHVTFLGVIRDGFAIRVVELSTEMVEEHGVVTKDQVTLSVAKEEIGTYEITSFAQRL